MAFDVRPPIPNNADSKEGLSKDLITIFAQGVADTAITFFEDLQKKFSNGMAVSLDELQRDYIEKLDMIILKEEEQTGSEYVGGDFKITKLDARSYNCSYALYFEGKNGKVREVSAHSKPLFIDGLTQDVRDELAQKIKIEFEVGDPSEESKAKYAALKERALKERSAEKKN